MLRPNVSHCIQENEVHYNPKGWKYEYFQFESLEDDNTIYFKSEYDDSFARTISVSTDNGATWTEYTSSNAESGTAIATLNTGGVALLKGENDDYSDAQSWNHNHFNATKQFNVQGNIMSLFHGDSFKTNESIEGKNILLIELFSDCETLVNAKNLRLPATTLATSSYSSMFSGCINLITAPELPATTLASNCYSYMFNGCTSLTAAPELPATTLENFCYQYMFSGCTSLTAAPELPATTLAQSCYNSMFQNCTNLTVAPELPATTLAEGCYMHMFQGCTSLTTAPELLATELERRCYQYMFSGCTSLTTAPELPALTLVGGAFGATQWYYGCYVRMFYGCTSLNYIKAMFTTTPSTIYTSNWVDGVAATGTFVKNAAAQWNVTGVDGIPTGWTVETVTA